MPLHLVCYLRARRSWTRTAVTDWNFAEEKDLVIIGGGVAGYVAAIKAGQEGMKVGRLS